MDPSLLQQFRQQLASWTETRLASQRLPFQRLELCPTTVTDQGNLTPDMILWINRDSQLAGSMILLPDSVNDEVLAQGASLAKALGLGHFTTWAAHDVTIWKLDRDEVERLQSFTLPPANQVTPEDFQYVLGQLLDQLKIITITCSPAIDKYPAHYFANLCLRNLQELIPGLTDSARLTAGQTAGDHWVESAPRDKAWLSLWRILYLLWKEQLPPGLQPEKLELALQYALSDITGGPLSWLEVNKSEPPLPDEAAVRLHHLTSRLRQLGWPTSNQQAHELVKLLLDEARNLFDLQSPALPWPTDQVSLRVGCLPQQEQDNCSLIAPRACLAGWALQNTLLGDSGQYLFAETIQSLDAEQTLLSGLALLLDSQTPSRQEIEERLLLLRQVWPSRRFDLPRSSPSWLWDALYLGGRIKNELTLLLPTSWHRAAGVNSLWSTLNERFCLSEIYAVETEWQALHFVAKDTSVETIHIYRNDHTISVTPECFSQWKIATFQLWVSASEEVLDLLTDEKLVTLETHDPDWSDSIIRGLSFYLQTRLGKYLWDLCTDHTPLPDLNDSAKTLVNSGLPVPNEIILADLGMTTITGRKTTLDAKQLEREFACIFGPTPNLPFERDSENHSSTKVRRRGRAPSAESVEKVFLDGIPHFPEHYLMRHYRPKQQVYELFGPLELAGEFFDQISLRSISTSQHLEVAGKPLAQALILASYSNANHVSLPEDERILEEIIKSYCTDLEKLWDNLVRECRRTEPQRQLAINQAKKVWQQRGLPPEGVYRSG